MSRCTYCGGDDHGPNQCSYQPPAAPVEASERDRCIAICEGWMERFEEGAEIQYTSAREYACDAINDIIDLIRDGKWPGEEPAPGTVDRVARAICLAEFGDEATHGDARCCQVGGTDGCCLEAVRPVAEAALAAMPAEPPLSISKEKADSVV